MNQILLPPKQKTQKVVFGAIENLHTQNMILATTSLVYPEYHEVDYHKLKLGEIDD
jgi:hypothetical protein